MNPQKSLFGLWKSFLGVQESILRSKGVVFAPMSKLSILLKVYLGSLEVNLWSLECEFGLWHSKLRPLGVDFRLPKGRVLLQRRGFLEHSPRVPFGLRALFYLMFLRFFLIFPTLGPLALIERVVDAWLGVFLNCVYLQEKFLSQNGFFSRTEQNMIYFKF